jgi:hypothetical protein
MHRASPSDLLLAVYSVGYLVLVESEFAAILLIKYVF